MATTTAAAASGIFGIRIQDPSSGAGRVQAKFNFSFGKKKPAPPPKKTKQIQNDGDRLVWFPGANPPEWLDGSMIGDRGFDPFGLGKPAEYLQYDFDGLDQNLAKNVAVTSLGSFRTRGRSNRRRFSHTPKFLGSNGSENAS